MNWEHWPECMSFGHRVTLLRHPIAVSLHGVNLGFIRTYTFHHIGIDCGLSPIFSQIGFNGLDTS